VPFWGGFGHTLPRPTLNRKACHVRRGHHGEAQLSPAAPTCIDPARGFVHIVRQGDEWSGDQLMALWETRWSLIGAALIALGMVGAGWLIGHGFQEGRRGEHYVTVKGLAETFVQADLAIWPLRYTATGDDLNQVQAKIDADGAEITAFLTREGIAAEAIQPQRVEVTDLLAQAYRPEGAASNRFIIAQTILVRTEQVDLVAELNRTTGELVSRGVVLVDTGGPTYVFTGLNAIKPQMLADASTNARAAAEQFAADVDSTLAGIRRASQGIFEILPRDAAPGITEESQIDKKVRVVSTIEYLLGPFPFLLPVATFHDYSIPTHAE
jgi:hypothetical protein